MDIVERLRKYAKVPDMLEAANEIERLRKELAEQKYANGPFTGSSAPAIAELKPHK